MMNKKIALVTIYGNENFGNKLQMYALYKFLEEHTDYQFEYLIEDDECMSIKFKNFIRKMLNGKKSISGLRFQKFLEFDNMIPHKKSIVGFINSKLPKDYDFYIVGSDQVWRPGRFGINRKYLLHNINSSKRISYASSFGNNNVVLSSKEKSEFLKFKSISVREDSGKEVLEKFIVNNDVKVLIDPTMLLESNEWDVVAKEPSAFKLKKYILNYFLGNLSYERKKEIERIAKEYDCDIVNLLDENDPYYNCGPSEFLWLEKNAFLICTDSFHSSVFAFLYNRPFVVFDREQKGMDNMNSRLDTLIAKFGLKNRKFDERITKDNIEHDYSDAYIILEQERRKSTEYLLESIK